MHVNSCLLCADLIAELTPQVMVTEGAAAELCINITDLPTNASLPRSVHVALSTEGGTAGT